MLECISNGFGTMEAQIFIPMFGCVQTTKAHDELLYFRRTSAGYVILNIDIGNLVRKKKKKITTTQTTLSDDTHKISRALFAVLHGMCYIIPHGR